MNYMACEVHQVFQNSLDALKRKEKRCWVQVSQFFKEVLLPGTDQYSKLNTRPRMSMSENKVQKSIARG